jgi:hypothetical protein
MQMEGGDVWFCAGLLIHCHGAEARIAAAHRSAYFERDGDEESAQAWARIHQAIIALSALPPHGLAPNEEPARRTPVPPR